MRHFCRKIDLFMINLIGSMRKITQKRLEGLIKNVTMDDKGGKPKTFF